MRFLDSNVFIYTFMRSPKKDYEIAKGILERIKNGEPVAVTSAVIYEVIDWLEYNNREKEVASFLTAINSLVALDKLSAEWEMFLLSLPDKYEKHIDFVDSLTLQVMKKNGVSEIYSNDKDFDRVEWVKRIWE